MKYKTSSTLPKTLLWCTRLHEIQINGLVCALDWWSDLFFKFMEQSAHQISGVQWIRLHELLVQWSSLRVGLVGQFRRQIRGVVCRLNSWSSLRIRLVECCGSGCIGVRLVEQFAFQISGIMRCPECMEQSAHQISGVWWIRLHGCQISGVVCALEQWSSVRREFMEQSVHQISGVLQIMLHGSQLSGVVCALDQQSDVAH